jgi:hypothetical protein
MDRNIITAKDAANQQFKQEAAILERWMQILRGDLYNSQIRLGDALNLSKDALAAEYWRGCIDTTQYILALMEATVERKKNV